MRQAIHMWLNYLDEDASLTGFVVINAEETTVFRNRNWYKPTYRLVEMDRFEELLNDKYETISEDDRNIINSTLVSQVALNAVKPYDERTRVFDMKSLGSFK